MNKLENLKELQNKVNLIVKNIDNYPKDEINVVVANHNCLMDIFYLPMALPNEIVSLISARLVYKNEQERKDIVNKYLYAMPIEAHGGRVYTDMCLNKSLEFLLNKKSVSIFPEGAYVYDRKVFKGHTGASRLVYNARNNNQQVNLVPVSIYVSRNDDLDSYDKIGDDVEITILPPIDYETSYYNYKYAKNNEEKNIFLHQPIDIAMKQIADNLNVPYENNYIKLRNKGNVIFNDGLLVDTVTAQQDEYVNRYNEELKEESLKLLRIMK